MTKADHCIVQLDSPQGEYLSNGHIFPARYLALYLRRNKEDNKGELKGVDFCPIPPDMPESKVEEAKAKAFRFLLPQNKFLEVAAFLLRCARENGVSNHEIAQLVEGSLMEPPEAT